MVKFRDSSAILEAARAGHSIAMVSALVAHHDLSSGRLALVSRCSVDRGGAYYLKANPTVPAAATFAGWLRQVVAQNTNSGADLEWNGRDGVAKTPTVGVST